MQQGRILFFFFSFALSFCAVADERAISSLGRLEPENGVVQLAGPSGGGLTGTMIVEPPVIARSHSPDSRLWQAM